MSAGDSKAGDAKAGDAKAADAKAVAAAAGAAGAVAAGAGAAAAVGSAAKPVFVITPEAEVYLTLPGPKGRTLEMGTDTADLTAFCHLNPRDPSRLAETCKVEAAQGNASAINNLGWCTFFGVWGVPCDEAKAYALWGQAAAMGCVSAQVSQTVCLALGVGGVQKDEKAAYDKFLALSKPPTKSMKALLALGMCLNTGTGCRENMVAAFAAFKRAAENGLPDGVWEVQRCYEEGEGVEHDRKESMKWCHRAAELGVTNAMHKLGVVYALDEPDPEAGIFEADEKQGMSWFRRAADLGDVFALCRLAECLNRGLGIDEGDEPALEAARKQARDLLKNWLNSPSVPPNVDALLEVCDTALDLDLKAEAFKAATLAAARGDGTAAGVLRSFYRFGVGTAKDRVKADDLKVVMERAREVDRDQVFDFRNRLAPEQADADDPLTEEERDDDDGDGDDDGDDADGPNGAGDDDAGDDDDGSDHD